MKIFGILDESTKQLVLNPANNRDPWLFTSAEYAQPYLERHSTCKVVELEITIGTAVTHKSVPAFWAASPKPTVRILPLRRQADTSYPFIVSLFEGDKFVGVLEDFRTKEDATKWAESNGYQVAEAP
jgi:hypothetical protein